MKDLQKLTELPKVITEDLPKELDRFKPLLEPAEKLGRKAGYKLSKLIDAIVDKAL